VDVNKYQSLKGKTALIVEDNILNQLIVQRFLDVVGMNYKVADDGCFVVKLIENQHFDIILLDLNIPCISGLEIAKTIRELESNELNKIPIVAITASDTYELFEKLQTSGINDCLQKPYTPENLYELLLKHLAV
jgi:CheY-like chemotaxis protein